MTNNTPDICMALMRADTADEVVEILRELGYWDEPLAWRFFGDNQNNYSGVGNQQSDPVAALIEKIINSVDARLLDLCQRAGIDPQSSAAPDSIRSAVAQFYGGVPGADRDGRIDTWLNPLLNVEGQRLTVAATGLMPTGPRSGYPSLTIADQGEGQTPDQFPDTFMSLSRENKMRVPFVQGKYNMGGTGALQFCSDPHNLQLVVSRRNPALMPPGSSGRSTEWGFTIVRREAPSQGHPRSSAFTYLAPIDAGLGRQGKVLSFAADEWPIFPKSDSSGREAYARRSTYGSLVKLYEYEYHGTRTNIVLGRGGLLSQLDMGMPELALPVRLYECRTGYRGHPGSFSTNLLGLSSRLTRDKKDKLESGFPLTHVINLHSAQIKVRIFAFKRGEGRDYKTRQGILLTVNGQTHATYNEPFFTRQKVGLSYLAKDLLVLCDCSELDTVIRERLFMNSRDRIRDTAISRELEAELERLLGEDPDLRVLRNRRRQEELADKLTDNQPLQSVLSGILKTSPTLAKLLTGGTKLSSPFPPHRGSGEGPGEGSGEPLEFHGKPFPTFFNFKGKPTGHLLTRAAAVGSRPRIAFETDADDDYFIRDIDPAAMKLVRVTEAGDVDVAGWRFKGPKSGEAQITLAEVPQESAIGTLQRYRLEVTDPSRVDAFVNNFELRIQRPSKGGTPGDPRKRGGGSTLALPTIVEITEADFSDETGYNEMTALNIKSTGDGDEATYDFYVNVDNKYLRTLMKESTKADPQLLKAKFTYSLVLIAMALLQDLRTDKAHESEDSQKDAAPSPEEQIARTTRAIAPVILPVLDAIGGLALDELG